MQNQTNTAEICGKIYDVSECVIVSKREESEKKTKLPIVSIPYLSDYKYQLIALKSRLEYPECYEETENISEAKEDLKKWLLERTVTHLYLKHKDEFEECYKYIFQRS